MQFAWIAATTIMQRRYDEKSYKLNKNVGQPVSQLASLIRVIALCFIVVCHIMQYLENELALWFNVSVQIFLCISVFVWPEEYRKCS